MRHCLAPRCYSSRASSFTRWFSASEDCGAASPTAALCLALLIGRHNHVDPAVDFYTADNRASSGALRRRAQCFYIQLGDLLMFTKVVTASVLSLGLVFAAFGAVNLKSKDCCEKSLACCKEGSACCKAEHADKLACCMGGKKCCADLRGCCSTAQKCCQEGEGKACCDDSKACCGEPSKS
jgi:hypothetical protein